MGTVFPSLCPLFKHPMFEPHFWLESEFVMAKTNFTLGPMSKLIIFSWSTFAKNLLLKLSKEWNGNLVPKKSGEAPTNCKNKYFYFSLSISRKKEAIRDPLVAKWPVFQCCFRLLNFLENTRNKNAGGKTTGLLMLFWKICGGQTTRRTKSSRRDWPPTRSPGPTGP